MNKYHDAEYHNTLEHILTTGKKKMDRTGTGTLSVFGTDMRFNLSDMSIPLLTTKKMNINSILHELLWFISGDTNVKYLNDNGVKIWNMWSDDDGNLGPIYGKQWRKIETWDRSKQVQTQHIDQLQNVINLIKTDPDSRRIIVDSWNVTELHKMNLPPCHCFFQFWVNMYRNPELGKPKGELKCKLIMRSSDFFLGTPFNIVQYSILTHMIAQICDLEATEFIYSGSDSHVYLNHLEQIETQLTRDPYLYKSPTLSLNKNIKNIDDFKFEDFDILEYNHCPAINAPVSK